MRAWEFLGEDQSPPVTLRALHQLKLNAKRHEASERDRMALMRIMYADPAAEQEQLELDRQRLELTQLRAEIAATKAETASKSPMVILKNAKSGVAAMEKSRGQVTKLARNGLGRKLKA